MRLSNKDKAIKVLKDALEMDVSWNKNQVGMAWNDGMETADLGIDDLGDAFDYMTGFRTAVQIAVAILEKP